MCGEALSGELPNGSWATAHSRIPMQSLWIALYLMPVFHRGLSRCCPSNWIDELRHLCLDVLIGFMAFPWWIPVPDNWEGKEIIQVRKSGDNLFFSHFMLLLSHVSPAGKTKVTCRRWQGFLHFKSDSSFSVVPQQESSHQPSFLKLSKDVLPCRYCLHLFVLCPPTLGSRHCCPPYRLPLRRRRRILYWPVQFWSCTVL